MRSQYREECSAGNATLVSLVPRHHDVTIHPPALPPATDREEVERVMGRGGGGGGVPVFHQPEVLPIIPPIAHYQHCMSQLVGGAVGLVIYTTLIKLQGVERELWRCI